MLDRDRVLGKIDELDSYIDELKQILPENFSGYKKIEKKRSCERLLQLSIECIIDICKLFVSGLRLGLPGGENDLFEKLNKNNIISDEMASLLVEMRGFRNILIHEYADVDDEIVYEAIKKRLPDFMCFKGEILKNIKS